LSEPTIEDLKDECASLRHQLDEANEQLEQNTMMAAHWRKEVRWMRAALSARTPTQALYGRGPKCEDCDCEQG
jgi:phage terminase large subunit